MADFVAEAASVAEVSAEASAEDLAECLCHAVAAHSSGPAFLVAIVRMASLDPAACGLVLGMAPAGRWLRGDQAERPTQTLEMLLRAAATATERPPGRSEIEQDLKETDGDRLEQIERPAAEAVRQTPLCEMRRKSGTLYPSFPPFL